MLQEKIVNVETGETTYRNYTDEEMAEAAAAQAEAEARQAELQAQIEAKAAAEAKLEALGLTAEDLKALGL
jgi:hypothetical protein